MKILIKQTTEKDFFPVKYILKYATKARKVGHYVFENKLRK